MRRDFTYIDDIVEGVVRVVDHVATPDPAWDDRPRRPRHQRRAVPAVQHRQP
jgi:UDP-glucuronate 4-epimerase